MSNVNTRRGRLSRRTFLKGFTLTGASVTVGLPPLISMFNAHGTAYAAGASERERAIETRFVLWFNGNGIPERYWIPATGADYRMTPCLAPLAPFRADIHVISGLDNAAAAMPGPGNGHHKSMSALMSCTPFTGRGTAVHRSIRPSPRSSTASRASGRCRSASRRNPSAKASSAT